MKVEGGRAEQMRLSKNCVRRIPEQRGASASNSIVSAHNPFGPRFKSWRAHQQTSLP